MRRVRKGRYTPRPVALPAVPPLQSSSAIREWLDFLAGLLATIAREEQSASMLTLSLAAASASGATPS